MKITGSRLAAALAVIYFIGGGIASITAGIVAAHHGHLRFTIDAAMFAAALLATGATLAVLFTRPDPTTSGDKRSDGHTAEARPRRADP